MANDEERPDEFTTILLLLLERVTTLSTQVEAMRALLTERGALSEAEVTRRSEDLRREWQLADHPHSALSAPSPTAKVFAELARILRPSATDA